MKNKEKDIDVSGLSKLQALFGSGEEENSNYDIQMLKLEDTYDFEKHYLKIEFEGEYKKISVSHPFDVEENVEMEELSESIREYGVLEPGICRPGRDGKYEVISGHRRKRAAILAGVTEMPFIIRNLSDAEATIIMVDSNKYRKNIKISSYAKAMYMKYYAIKHQGKRKDLIKNLEKLEEQSHTGDLEELASKEGMSLRKLQRLIRLANLPDGILQLVDQKIMGITPAVALSYLSMHEQAIVYGCMIQLGSLDERKPYIPTLDEANQLKTLSKNSENGLLSDDIFAVFSKKKNGVSQIKERKISFSREKIFSYFPESFNQEDVEKILFSLLEEWKKKNSPKDDNIPLPGQIDLQDYMDNYQ